MKVLSLGLGVQSTWIYLASSMGMMPPIDVAIFADTGKEKTKTLQYLVWLQNWAKTNSNIPIHVVSDKNLYQDLLQQVNCRSKRFASIPAFTKNQDGTTGMLKRQCTSDYKIVQIDKKIRQLHGLKRGQRMTSPVEVWKGISLDEIERMAIPQEKWKTFIYPFCGYSVPAGGQAAKINTPRMTRIDIIKAYNHHNLPIPPKSSCVFCPYQSERSWYEMKTNEPEDFAAAVAVDEAIRCSTNKGITAPAYLHDSCKPLKDVDFSLQAVDLWKGECSGTCHV